MNTSEPFLAQTELSRCLCVQKCVFDFVKYTVEEQYYYYIIIIPILYTGYNFLSKCTVQASLTHRYVAWTSQRFLERMS
jgi:hypothetical protein